MSYRLGSEKGRLETELEHVQRDEASLKQEVDSTEDAISEQTSDFDSRRDELQMMKFQVDADILDLKRRLEEKEVERKTVI